MYDSKLKPDNKLRLSSDIISKAEEIAQAWGLKNSRAAIEAVFRKYADDYLYGRQPAPILRPPDTHPDPPHPKPHKPSPPCDALDELEAFLSL